MLTLYVICFNEKKHESVRMNFFLLRSAFAGEPVEDDGSKRKSSSGNKMLVLFKKVVINSKDIFDVLIN